MHYHYILAIVKRGELNGNIIFLTEIVAARSDDHEIVVSRKIQRICNKNGIERYLGEATSWLVCITQKILEILGK